MQMAQLSIDTARSAVQERKTTALALAETHYARIENEDVTEFDLSGSVTTTKGVIIAHYTRR